MRRRVTAIVVSFLLCLGCALGVSGCLESDVLVNYVLDPSSENVDYDNPLKTYVPDANATLTAQDIAATTNLSVEEVDKILDDEAVYNTDNGTTDDPAESGTHSSAANSSTTAPQQQQTSDGRHVQSSNNNSSDNGEGGSDGSEQGTDKDPSTGDGDSKATEPGTVYNANGKLENLPIDLTSVCAVGNVATIVLSIAGADYLAGSSEAYLGGKNNQRVFGSQALSSIATCWDNDGTDEGDLDVASIIKLKPSAVLMETGSDTVSSAAQKKLRNAGIALVALPQLASDTYIKKAVRSVGQLFSETTGGASTKRADKYVSLVDDVLKAAKATHGGTVATYNNVDYDNITDANPVNTAAGGPTNWTTFITGWDDDATVTAYFDGKAIFTETGVALAQVGWKTSPVSYYMGCGGAVNNAAAYGSYSASATRLFLNYNENQVSYSWSNLDGNVTVGKDGGSFKQGGTYLLTNACDARDTEAEHHLGSPDFNKVIVKTQTIKDKLTAARKKPLGLYTPGTYQTVTGTSGYGLNLNGELLRCYSVTADDTRNDTLYGILVNPCGLVGTWSEGSMESFLEAVWVAHEFCGYDAAKLEEDIRDFYETFYGYSLTTDELESILDGTYAED